MPYHIKKQLLIICEGISDRYFLQNLIKRRNINLSLDTYDIVIPKDLGADADGKTQWEKILSIIIGSSGVEKLKFIILVTDNDDDPKNALDNITTAIKNANKKYNKEFFQNIPLTPLEDPSKFSKTPAIFVITMPGIDRKGNIETLCYAVAYEKAESDVKICIDGFANCSCFNDKDEEFPSVSKLKLSSIIACIFSRNNNYPPIYNFKYLWDDSKGGDADIIPLEHEKFNWIEDYFKSFALLLNQKQD
jgi:hypothetical protein